MKFYFIYNILLLYFVEVIYFVLFIYINNIELYNLILDNITLKARYYKFELALLILVGLCRLVFLWIQFMSRTAMIMQNSISAVVNQKQAFHKTTYQ